MKKIIRCLLVLLVVAASAAAAEDRRLLIYCEDCRNIVEHPEDARNFGLNQLYGAASWLTFDQADRFDIVDRFGQRATIDINIAYIVLDLTMFWKNLPYALNIILQVRVVYPTGDIMTYRFDVSDLSPNASLPVPASATEQENTPTADAGDRGSNEEDEDYGAEEDEARDEFEPEDGSCGACEAYFDADEDGMLDDDPVEWIEEL